MLSHGRPLRNHRTHSAVRSRGPKRHRVAHSHKQARDASEFPSDSDQPRLSHGVTCSLVADESGNARVPRAPRCHASTDRRRDFRSETSPKYLLRPR